MYLNVNLTPPPTQSGGGGVGEGGIGSCGVSSTPKTPEILNSLISLSAAPSYPSQIWNGVESVPSPASSLASPTDDPYTPPTSSSSSASVLLRSGGGTPTTSTPTSCPLPLPPHSSPQGGSATAGTWSPTRAFARASGGTFLGSPTTSTAPLSLHPPSSCSTTTSSAPGTPTSPPTAAIPSPVTTVEATKSALIKEGLKIQIKSKLQAAGLEPSEILSDRKSVKEEVSDSLELTPQDEERRMRRRERNKIAATKCRNKKKEKTVILMSESETVEDQNHRLKSEIQRLTTEKIKLEKLLDDPNHVASCRHSCGRTSHSSHTSLVVVTSPDAPERLLPTSSGEGLLLHTSGGSDQSANDLPFCSRSVSSPQEQTFASDSSSPSYVNLSPSTISPLSLPSVSPTHSVTGKPLSTSQTSPTSVMPSYLQTPPHFPPITEEAPLFPLTSSSADATQNLSSLGLSAADPLPAISSLDTVGPSSSRAYLSHKPSKLQTHNKRVQQYSLRPSRAQTFNIDSSVTPQTHDLIDSNDYSFQSIIKDELPNVSESFLFQSPPRNGEYSVDITTSSKHDFMTGKLRSPIANSQCRYTPYDRSNRQHQFQQQQLQNIHIPNVCQIQSTTNSLENTLSDETLLQTSCNPFLSDATQGHFYASCSYENI